jgi:hypothetical protein
VIVTGGAALDKPSGLLLGKVRIPNEKEEYGYQNVAEAAKVAMGHDTPVTFYCDMIEGEVFEGKQVLLLFAVDDIFGRKVKIANREWQETVPTVTKDDTTDVPANSLVHYLTVIQPMGESLGGR